MVRRTSFESILLAVGLVLALAVASAAEPIVQVEGEDYTEYNNIGGNIIQSVYCASASGQLAVDYIDRPGEWILVEATFAETGCYEPVLAFQTDFGEPALIRLTMIKAAAGEDIISEFSVVGSGIG